MYDERIRDRFEREFESAHELEQSGRLQEAAAAYDRALQAQPQSAEAHFNLGNVLCELGRFDEARRRFEAAIEMQPQFAPAWFNLADVYDELGYAKESVLCLERAVAIEPHFADAHFNLARCLQERDDVDSAAAHWAAYLRLDHHGEWAELAREGLRRCHTGSRPYRLSEKRCVTSA